jgi:hypothetical protein
MIAFFRQHQPRPFRIKPADTFDAIRDELRRFIEDARNSLGAVPKFEEKTISFRGGDTNVKVGFGFRPRVLVVGRVENPLAPGSAVTASATSSGSVTKLWEWNGTDTSQFEASADFNGSTVTAMGTPTLTAATDATVPGGKTLQLTAGGSPAGYAAAHWLVKASESTLTYPNRYRWEWAVRASYAAYGGLSFFANPATDHYYGINVLSLNGTRHRVDAGTVVNFLVGTNSNLATGASNDTAGFIELYGETQSAAAPRFELTGRGISGANTPLAFHHCDSGSSDGTWQTSGTNPPSSWHGLAANRWGLSLVSISGGAAGTLTFSRLALYRIGDDASGASASSTTTAEPPGLSVDWVPASSPTRGATIRAISGLTTGTDYKITLFAVGAD